jgi:hypothetical protein
VPPNIRRSERDPGRGLTRQQHEAGEDRVACRLVEEPGETQMLADVMRLDGCDVAR